jgi:PiT family inorganic phosphate transporter
MVLAPFFIYAGGVASFAVAFGMGANNVSNAIGTSVGSGAISRKTGLILAGICEFLGTVLMGGMVTETLKSAIIAPEHFLPTQQYFAIGMFSTMIMALVWLLIATHYALPISATQTIIGGIIGFSIVELKWMELNHSVIFVIVISWFLSPIIGALVAAGLYYSVYKLVLEKGECSKFAVPFYYGMTIAILVGFIIQSNSKTLNIPEDYVILIIACIFMISFVFVYWKKPTSSYTLPTTIPNFKNNEFKEETNMDIAKDIPVKEQNPNETPFKFLMIFSAAFVAFAHGSNDVSNAAAPYAAMVEFYRYGQIRDDSAIPSAVIIECGVGIVVGMFVLGYKTLETVGEKITKLTFSKGYAAQMSAASTILLASILSLPISTTAILIGSIVGVGLIGDESGNAVDKQVLYNIVSGWFLTVIVGLLGTPVIFLLIKLLL